MSRKTRQCRCGNWVEGKPVQNFGHQVAGGLAKKGGAMGGATGGAIIGSILLPGIGTAVGGFLGGLLGSKAVGDSANDLVNEVFVDNYEFTCPKCGRKWHEKIG